MVKWIHIADVHLGASPDAGDAYSKVRPQELWDTFAEVIDICEREQTDLLLIAGDLFHRQPLKKELKEVISFYKLHTPQSYDPYPRETAQAVIAEAARLERLLQEHPEQAEETYIPPEEYLAQIKGTMFW